MQFATYYTVHDTYDAGESVATRNVQELTVQSQQEKEERRKNSMLNSLIIYN